MKIKTITSQNRRDFTAIYECEHCEFEIETRGYDDDNFHKNVIPNMPCPECGEVSPNTYKPRATKYAAWQVV